MLTGLIKNCMYYICFHRIIAVLSRIWCECRAQWLRGRASDCRLREPGFESCAAVLKPWASLFTLHCSSSLSCINDYRTINSGGYVYERSSRINCSIWLDVSQRSQNGVWVNRSVREVECKERSWGLDTTLYMNLLLLFLILFEWMLTTLGALNVCFRCNKRKGHFSEATHFYKAAII